MQETLHQTADAKTIRQRMHDTLSDGGCRGLSIRQRMQKSLYQTADAGDSISDSGCRTFSIRQRMQETLLQTADAGDSIRQRMQETIRQRMKESLLQTVVAGDSPSDS